MPERAEKDLAGITGDCELPLVLVGIGIWVLCKGSMGS